MTKKESEMTADELCDPLWRLIECGIVEEIHHRLTLFTEGKLFQPEAPACTSPGGVGDCYDINCPSPVCNPPEAHLAKQNENELLMTAPKGQEACWTTEYGSCERHTDCTLAAANARIAELTEKGYKAARLLIDANARADAAERVALSAERMNATALREREQLAARVKELEVNGYRLLNGEQLCTTEERAELDALDAIPDSELSSSGNWYGWAKPIGVAVLANRAAKAKRNEK